jgi:hypothetical protein
MGSKLVKLNEHGEIQHGPKYVEEKYSHMYVSYEVDKSYSRPLRTISSCGRTRPTNRFQIKDKDGYFEIVWNAEYQMAPNDWRVKQLEVQVAQFAKLKDAEKYAIKLAFEMADIYSTYSYNEIFTREENLRIENLTLIKQIITKDDQGSKVEYVASDLNIKNIDLDTSSIESKRIERTLRNKQREARLQGGEDTRIMVKVLMNVNLTDLEASIADYLQGEVDSVDGVGADGESIYNVDEVQVKVESTGQIEATFYLERESGKFASADELSDSIMTQLGSHGAVEVPIEMS